MAILVAVLPGAGPAAGPISLELFQLRLADQPELVLILQIPASEQDARQLCRVQPPG